MRKKHAVYRPMRLFCLLLLLCLPLWTACAQAEGDLSCTLAIYSDEAVLLEETVVYFSSGESVLDILKRATRDAKMQMEYTGTGFTAYVQGIDNVYEFDKGPESGWVYTVNGEYCQESCGSVLVEEGDVITWQYILTQ